MAELKGNVPSKSCPVHPTLVHLPLALFPLSALTRLIGTQPNVMSMFSGLDSTSFFAGAHYLNLAALLVTIPTSVTGYLEYSKIPASQEAARATVHRHMALNTVVTLIALGNWYSLRNRADFEPDAIHVIVGIIGVLLLWYSSHLGRTLVYKHGVGVAKQDTIYR